MTLKHLAEGLMQATGARCHNECTSLLGLPQGTLCRMTSGAQKDLLLQTFFLMADNSGMPVETLAAWYRMEDGETLGRLSVAPQFVERTKWRVRIEKSPVATSTKRVQAFRARQKAQRLDAEIGRAA